MLATVFFLGRPAFPGVTRRPSISLISSENLLEPKAKFPLVAFLILSTSPGLARYEIVLCTRTVFLHYRAPGFGRERGLPPITLGGVKGQDRINSEKEEFDPVVG